MPAAFYTLSHLSVYHLYRDMRAAEREAGSFSYNVAVAISFSFRKGRKFFKARGLSSALPSTSPV